MTARLALRLGAAVCGLTVLLLASAPTAPPGGCEGSSDAAWCATALTASAAAWLPCPPPYAAPAAGGLPGCAAALGAAAAHPHPGTPALLHRPDVRTLRAPARVVLDVAPCLSAQPPAHAVVVSAHDAERSLPAALDALLHHTVGPWELLVVLDGCRDGSEAAARAALAPDRLRASRGLLRARVLLHPTPVWETSSDNSGLALAHPGAQLALLLQPDMHLTERGWNVRLALPTRLFADVWAVSGRDAHNKAAGRGEGSAGWNRTEQRNLAQPPGAAELAAAAARLFVRDVVNRGPLALRLEPLRALGFLNERDFLIREDEHDLMLRAYLQRGLLCAKYAVGVFSPPHEGASRRKGRLARRSASEWLFLLYRTLRRRRAAREAPIQLAAAAHGGVHWNEERRIDPLLLAAAVTEAEEQERSLACGLQDAG